MNQSRKLFITKLIR